MSLADFAILMLCGLAVAGILALAGVVVWWLIP
jgi:hypothetical protein